MYFKFIYESKSNPKPFTNAPYSLVVLEASSIECADVFYYPSIVHQQTDGSHYPSIVHQQRTELVLMVTAVYQNGARTTHTHTHTNTMNIESTTVKMEYTKWKNKYLESLSIHILVK